MEWLAQNWLWLTLGIGLLFMMLRGGHGGGVGGCCGGGHGGGDKRATVGESPGRSTGGGAGHRHWKDLV